MIWGKKNKTIAFIAAGLFVLTGTYNAVVINSESHLSSSQVKFVKRLDEVYGVTVAGREVAATVTWQKLAPAPVIAKTKVISAPKVEAPVTAAPVEDIPVAAVQEELSLSLVEVINPKKYQQGLKADQFYGSLSTNSGVIEDLNVTLPNGEGVAVSFSEMTGNVFEYDFNGELYSGMMYQVDQHAYMVTLTNGPLEGTRMRFSSQAPSETTEQNQAYLADNNVEVGSFGQETAQMQEYNPDQMMNQDQRMQEEAMQAQGFNLDQTSAAL